MNFLTTAFVAIAAAQLPPGSPAAVVDCDSLLTSSNPTFASGGYCGLACTTLYSGDMDCPAGKSGSLNGSQLADCVPQHFPQFECVKSGGVAPPPPTPSVVCSATCPSNYCGEQAGWQVWWSAQYGMCYYWNGTTSTWTKPY